METIIKVFLSLIIGIIGGLVAKIVHPNWTFIQLAMFGLLVFVVTITLALIIKK